MNLSRSQDTDVLKAIILKLEQRVQVGATTLLIKVKTHRGGPLNEEADIRAEMGRLKEYKETIWNDSSDRTVYECQSPPLNTGERQFSRPRYGAIL